MAIQSTNDLSNIDASDTLVVDLVHVIYALSDALDLVGIDDVGHGKRVGTMAANFAKSIGLPEEKISFIFELGLLHDIGVSSTAVHNHLVTEFDWQGSQKHCHVGYERLKNFRPLARMALPILYHHTRWDELIKIDGLEPAVITFANIIFLADRIDALAAAHYGDGSLLSNINKIRAAIETYSGNYFSPELVDSFLENSDSEAFWLQLEQRALQGILREWEKKNKPVNASIAELKQIAEIFAQIVDAKSPFTTEHSLGVAKLARFIAKRMGVNPANCDKIEIAGLLHDLGKLRIPDDILNKPASLNERERWVINAHSFETFQILHQIKGFEEITQWASAHHEELDGSGYPFRIIGSELPLEARILRVSDIFQAMVQNRPYRNGLTADQVLAFMNDLVAQGRIEAKIVAALAADMPAAMAAALPYLKN